MSVINTASHIYTGFWIDHSRGMILGSTITHGAVASGYLTAFTAAFIVMVGNQLWRTGCFTLYQLQSSAGPQHAIYRQRQAILRNEGSPLGASWTFLQQGWGWRRTSGRWLSSTIPWALASFLFWAAFTGIAIISSEISKSSGSDRLIVSKQCGELGNLMSTSPSAIKVAGLKLRNDTTAAANYARACYGSTPDPLQCNSYVQPSLSWSSSRADCPFESSICLDGVHAQAFRMQSNLINSHTDLGINAPPHERVAVQKHTICAPLRPLTSVLDRNEDNVILAYNYGAIDPYNFTYFYSTESQKDDFTYELYPINAQANFENAWVPIPELARSDADLSMAMISQNSVVFNHSCADPIFQADVPLEANGIIYGYLTTNYVGTIACAEQYRVCDPVSAICSRFAGLIENFVLADSIGLSKAQLATSTRLLYALEQTNIWSAIATRASAALRAQELLQDRLQDSLPNNWWTVELSGWFEASLARLQYLTLEYATGPISAIPGLEELLQEQSTKPSQKFCHSQLVKETQGTESFSVLGLGILYGVGGLIIIVSFVIEPLTARIQTRKVKRATGSSSADLEYAHARWVADGLLQLQRQALEGAGQGTWSRTSRTVPVAGNSDLFGGRPQGDTEMAGTEGHMDEAMELGDRTTDSSDTQAPGDASAKLEDQGAPKSQSLSGEATDLPTIHDDNDNVSGNRTDVERELSGTTMVHPVAVSNADRGLLGDHLER